MPSKRSSSPNTKTRVRKRENGNAKFNIHHEDIRDQVELAFESGGVKYYRFKEQLQMPSGRYKYIYAYWREVEMRMSIDKLKEYVAELKKCLNGEKKVIDIEGAWRIVFNLETRTKLAFEPDGVKRLASVVYFDSTEDLSTFDKKHGDEKVRKWDKAKCLDFFLTRPISELLGLNGISITSLEEYLTTSEQILKDLVSGQPRPSPESL